jgi:hypothetical protein
VRDQTGIFSYHETFLKAEESCNEVGAYLADVQDVAESDFIKSVLNVINPKVKFTKGIIFIKSRGCLKTLSMLLTVMTRTMDSSARRLLKFCQDNYLGYLILSSDILFSLLQLILYL